MNQISVLALLGTLTLATNGCGNSSTTEGSNATGGTTSTGLSSTGGSSTGGSSTGGSSSNSSSSLKFSFFVTSQARLFALAQAFNGSTKGFGGDLRYGKTGAAAGLRGADDICTAIAEASAPGNGKTWRAFLSATDDGNGKQINAIDRIGSGPWYDRLGRLFANNTAELLNTRPTNANTSIINDFPNEDGVPNHDASQTGNTAVQDNHDILTGTNAQGALYSQTATCSDWTSSVGNASQKPHCGHSWPMATGGGTTLDLDAGMGVLMGFDAGFPMGFDAGFPTGFDAGFPTGFDAGMGVTGADSTSNWMSALDEAGCAAGYNLAEVNPNGQASSPGSDGTLTVGSGGGYGGIYCFALSQ
jgi:hypothetical protein